MRNFWNFIEWVYHVAFWYWLVRWYLMVGKFFPEPPVHSLSIGVDRFFAAILCVAITHMILSYVFLLIFMLTCGPKRVKDWIKEQEQ